MYSIQWYGLSGSNLYIYCSPNQLQRGKPFYGTPGRKVWNIELEGLGISHNFATLPYSFWIFLTSSLSIFCQPPTTADNYNITKICCVLKTLKFKNILELSTQNHQNMIYGREQRILSFYCSPVFFVLVIFESCNSAKKAKSKGKLISHF